MLFNFYPINTPFMRLGMGLGGGLAGLLRSTINEVGHEYDFSHSGVQAIGQTAVVLNARGLGLNARILWIRTSFERDEGGYRLVNKNIGSGVFFALGLTYTSTR